MKKIIVAFDGLQYSDNSLQYALMLAASTPAHLVGVSLESMLYNSYSPYEVATEPPAGKADTARLAQLDQQSRNIAVDFFLEACRQEGVNCSIHRDKYFALDDLLRETIYADLLVIDTQETMSRERENAPTTFIRRLLADTQCPVFLANGGYEAIDKVVLLFDGSPAAVHAIKMIHYTLPGLDTLPVEIVTVNDADEGNHLPDQYLMKEFMKRHHPGAHYTVLRGNAPKQILEHLRENSENTLVVMGAYQRGALSRFFHESLADVLIRNIRCPLFIAHK
ncbi:Nucleotide-binding universal stress protein, UspA family [Chitinophaga costaii]|uniref:Nucleotide-binding universal stress protein, UspA family n=1 Tax=Chitinophaga costaii TaxID=1335309 RepID=A0A1C4FYY8_9BACT|nr:universal stress protein [Chitinophaga costaii]PUZ20930.1 universal stress protein [Chitinophaga costaii]SCC61084.1 Nucleotide-binding universal stress protein, UspA family [Chitinophaga costaii]